ncbi:MAG: hypothetical protein LBD09_01215 [Treponema sp.]|jgi:hypothetical protein|nr:hypothetical protein [Treponema sp.]
MLNRPRLFCLALLTAALVSCGLEDYIYLEPVESAGVISDFEGYANLPSQSAGEFRSYIIFYRIYISDWPSTGSITESQYTAINSVLAADYNVLKPYTTNDSVSPNAILSVLSGRRYYPLALSIDGTKDVSGSVLTSTAFVSVTLDFTFAPEPRAFLTYPSTGNPSDPKYYLFRASGFTQLPNRRFLNTTGAGDLADSSKIDNTTNIDVAPKDGDGIGSYTYVSMYILAFGTDRNFGAIFSRPKHIGVFRLPPPP